DRGKKAKLIFTKRRGYCTIPTEISERKERGDRKDENHHLVFVFLAVSDCGAAGVLAGVPHGKKGRNRAARPACPQACAELGRPSAAPGRGGDYHNREGEHPRGAGGLC